MQEKSPILSILVLLVIVGLIVTVLFLVFKPVEETNGNNETDNEITETVTPEPTTTDVVEENDDVTTTPTPATQTKDVADVTGATPPDSWQLLEYDCLGYKAYRPNGFYFRMFPPDCFVLGLDPNRIPEASEYMGMISMMKLSASNNFDKYVAELEDGYTEYTRVIDGRTWNMVEGKMPANELFEAKYVKLGNVEVNGKEYMARIENSASNFGGYADEFETFITTLIFD